MRKISLIERVRRFGQAGIDSVAVLGRSSLFLFHALLGRGGVILGSMYASGPVGRIGADEVVRLITTRERRRREQETGAH